MSLIIKVNNVDVTSSLIWGSLKVEKSAEQFNSIASFQLRNVAVVAEQSVYIYDDTWDIFKGEVATYKVATQTTTETIIDVKCVDLNDQLNKRVLPIAKRYFLQSDSAIIDDLFDDYLPAIDSETYVQTIQDPLPIDFEPATLRAVLSQICTRTGAYFYVDAQARLHYFLAETDPAGFDLSDEPDNFTTFSYLDDPVKTVDASRKVDGVFVKGDGVSVWRGSHGATDKQVIVHDNRLKTLAACQERGDSILNSFGSAKVSYRVKTAQPGLEVGQEIGFKCDLYGVNDDFTIRKMTITWEPGGAVYDLELGDPVNPALEGAQTWVDIIPQVYGPISAPRLPTSSLGWAHDLVFSATDHNTVAWAAGDITLADGSTYAIDAGNTGNMAAATYIYLDLDTSETALQTVTVSSTAVGAKKILVAVAYPSAVGYDATFMVYGQPGSVLVDTENILAGAVDTDQLAALAVTGAKIEALTIVGGHIAAATITGAKIAAATIEGGNIKANTITAANIAANTITTNEIAANTIVAGNIASGAITADEIAAGAIVGTKFSNLIGGLLFDQLNGLLLLGPHAALTPTSWTSSRGHVATISGAFHQEQGRWTGMRGLVVERGTTTLIANPQFYANIADGWTVYSTGTASGLRERRTNRSWIGPASLYLQKNAGADNDRWGLYAAVGTTTAGASYTAKLRVYMASTNTSTVKIHLLKPAGSGVAQSATGTVTGGSDKWVDVETPALTANATGDNLLLYIWVEGAPTALAYIDGVQCEAQAVPTSYCDGSLDWCSWTGLEHNSTSTRSGTTVTVPIAGAINPAAGAIVVNLKQLARNPNGGFLFSAGDALAEFDALQRASTGDLQFRINGATRITVPSASWPVGAEHEIVFTWDVAANTSQVLLNGVLAGAGTCGGGAWTPGTHLYIGGSHAGSTYALGGTVSQFATLGRVLTADEVAAMYALQRPLVDAGATTRPGIYILDGGFEIASSTSGSRLVLSSSSLSIGTDMTFLTGTGIWLGLDSGTPKMRIGYASGHSIVWNGSTLAVYGKLTSYSGIIGGWNMTSNALYKLSSGTPTSTPNTGITLEMEGGYNSLPIAKVYNGTTLVAALGSYSSSVQGIWARSGQIGGWSLTTTAIEKTGHAGIDSTNNLEKFWVRSSTWDTLGVQIEYNSGSPRMHVGAPSADRTNHLMYSSAGLEIVTFGGALRFNAVGFQFGLAEAASGGKTGAGVVWKNDLSSGANHNVTFGYIRMTTGPTTSDMEFVSGDRTAGVGGDNQYWRDMLFRNEAYIGAAGYTRTWLIQEASNRRLRFYGATNDATYSFINPGDNRVAMWVRQDNAAGTGAVLRIEQNLSRESYYIVFDGAYLDFSDGSTHKGRAIKVGVTTGGSWAGSGWIYVFDSATPPFAWA